MLARGSGRRIGRGARREGMLLGMLTRVAHDRPQRHIRPVRGLVLERRLVLRRVLLGTRVLVHHGAAQVGEARVGTHGVRRPTCTLA